jgi:hypothetical protein
VPRIKGLDRPPASARPAIPAEVLAAMSPLDRGAALLASAFGGAVVELALQPQDAAMSLAAAPSAVAPPAAPAPKPAPPAPPSAWEDRRDRCLAGEPVLASTDASGDRKLISWAKAEGRLVSIKRPNRGRPGPLGNPWRMTDDSEAERDLVCDKHAGWLDGDTELLVCPEAAKFDRDAVLAAIPELGGKVLVCCCAPKRCHGDELIRRWKEQQQGSAAPAPCPWSALRPHRCSDGTAGPLQTLPGPAPSRCALLRSALRFD